MPPKCAGVDPIDSERNLRASCSRGTSGRRSPFSKVGAALDAAVWALAGAGTVPARVYHDLRRALSTRSAELRVRIEHAEVLLNHVSSTKLGVAGTYNLNQYRAEKQEALQAWADHVEGLIGRALSLG